MEIVSSYVREQERYTKNDLKDIFSFDDNEVERFIKNLKAFGVLKSVKNSNDQMEMSELTDEDIEIRMIQLKVETVCMFLPMLELLHVAAESLKYTRSIF